MIKKCSDKDCFVHDGETCRIGEMDKENCEKYNPFPKPAYFERDGEPCGDGGSALNDGLGRILPSTAMFFHTVAGSAEGDNYCKYEMQNDMTGRPIIVSEQTRKRFILDWGDILKLAIKAGIDMPNAELAGR